MGGEGAVGCLDAHEGMSQTDGEGFVFVQELLVILRLDQQIWGSLFGGVVLCSFRRFFEVARRNIFPGKRYHGQSQLLAPK